MLLEGRGVLGARPWSCWARPAAADRCVAVVERPVLRGDAVLGVLRVTWPATAARRTAAAVVELLAAELGAVLERSGCWSSCAISRGPIR